MLPWLRPDSLFFVLLACALSLVTPFLVPIGLAAGLISIFALKSSF